MARGPKRIRISPGGIDIEALQKAEKEFPQADVERFRVISPAAARLAFKQSSAKGPLALTLEEIELFEEQANQTQRGLKSKRRASRDRISPDRIL